MAEIRPDRGQSRVRGILLAAGSSSRLGQPKQLLPFGGRPLVRHVAEQALSSRLAGLTVVVGYRAADVSAALDGLGATIVENPSYSRGQSTSLQAGLLDFPQRLSAALILLVDQPFVTFTLIDRLIALYEESKAPIVAPRFDGRRGNPVLFDRGLIPELLTVVGDTGARDVISQHRGEVATLELNDDRAFQDIDTWEDYLKISPG